MPVVIREIVSDIVVGRDRPPEQSTADTAADALREERLVRIVTERVLAHLEREWSH